jgi:hemerythrin-like metal-binding protein
MIIWTKDFETGSETLDQQHQLLIDHINLLEMQLHKSNPTSEEVEFAIHLVDYLEAYANIHFQAEEHCMAVYSCPVHHQNQAEHGRFRGFINNYKHLSETQGFRDELLCDLHAAVEQWIQEHILKLDTQLKPCILPQASRPPLLTKPSA